MISAKTKLFALVGDPIDKSLSPAIHNSAFESLGIDGVYVALRVPRIMLADAVCGIRALGIAGLNVTHPHKINIAGLLDELDESASLVGAVNTVKNNRGKLTGFNTDGQGAVKALKSRIKNVKGKKILLLGAGGAARAIAFSLARERVKLIIANRTTSKSKELASDIEQKLGAGVALSSLERGELKKAVENVEIVINATTIGMYPNTNKTLITADMMHKDLVVFDIVYEPIQTKLLREAKRAGASTINGLEMLVNQAALAFEIWTGKRAPVEIMKSAAKRELGKSI